MKHKRFTVLLLSAVLALSFSGVSFAATYADLAGHWSAQYMNDLAARGLLSGYEDSTMRPDREITGAEALVMLSRLFNLENKEAERLYADFGSKAEQLVPASMSWAYEGAAICLAAGVISETELSVFPFSAAIKKEYLSVLLVRAIQKDLDLPVEQLSFQDTFQITAAYRPYIKLLVNMGVITGDENNYFNPQSGVTRAVVATMFSKTLSKLESANSLPVLDDYMGMTAIDGIIIEVTDNSLYLLCSDGLTRIFDISSAVEFTAGGTVKTGFTYEGSRASVYFDTNTTEVKRVVAENDGSVWYYGCFVRTYEIGSSRTLYLLDLFTDETKNYNASLSSAVYIDGRTSSMTNLQPGFFIMLKYMAGRISEIHAFSSGSTITGTVLSIKYDSVITMRILDETGVSYCYYMNMAKQPKVLRNGVEVLIDKIRQGDTLSVTVKDCAVSLLNVENRTASLTGTLTKITQSAEGTSVSIKLENNTEATYPLSSGTVFWSGRNEIKLSDISIGDRVSLVLYSGLVTDVYLEEATVTTTKVSGTVLSIDTTKNQVILLSDENLVYVNFTTNANILLTSTGAAVKIAAIKVNDAMTAYGEYTAGNQFTAKSAVIE